VRGNVKSSRRDLSTPLLDLVERKLELHEGEHMLFAQYQRLPVPEPSFAQHQAAAIQEMNRRLASKRVALHEPLDPSLVSLKSWQLGFTDAGSEDEAVRSARDGLYLLLQSYRGDYVSTAQWRGFLEAVDRPGRWLELGEAAEADGWTIEANACFAAARWLDPTCEDRIAATVEPRSPALPARLRRQPDASYPSQPFGQRHWLAWDMKNYGRLDLPTLLRWECDSNFSIRARIYRSLGQRPHPASIQALQEGTFDPHPFARAQAARSLGWCADPTWVGALHGLSQTDPDAEVRRTAAKAVQRIMGFWRFYGEWNAIAASPARMLDVARQLIDEGLPALAYDIAIACGMADEGELGELVERIEGDAQEPERSGEAEQRSRYGYWFREAKALEAAGVDEPGIEDARRDALAAGARGFEARRTLRQREVGSIEERRRR
jgi:HEAT repeats